MRIGVRTFSGSAPILCACLLAILQVVFARADSFGRFGYSAKPGLDDLSVSLAGLQAVGANHSQLNFAFPATRFMAEDTQSTTQTFMVDGDPMSPKQIRTSLVGNSVDLYFPNGVILTSTADDSPYLSWSERSVGAGVPTDDVRWVLVSFQTAEPPYLLGLSGRTASFRVSGKKGAWIVAAPEFSGWLRVWLPFGLENEFANDAAGLGKIIQKLTPFEDVWRSETPTIRSVTIKSNETSVDATWNFSGPGAFVPQAAILAPYGNSSMEVKSPFRLLPGDSAALPRAVLEGNSMSAHFPCIRISPGRALGVGVPPPAASGGGEPIQDCIRLANANLVAWSGEDVLKAADATVTKYLTQCTYTEEPNTRQQLPYGADGPQVEMAAAQAYLAQCSSLALKAEQPNALFDSVLWKRDWWTWTIWSNSEETSRKATAFLALAGALGRSAESRFYGATLEAGLDALRGREVWVMRHGGKSQASNISEPLLGLRTGIFALTMMRGVNVDFFRLILSPLKIGVGESAVLVQDATGYQLELAGEAPVKHRLCFYGPPASLSATLLENVQNLELTAENQNLKLACVAVSPGKCTLHVAVERNVVLPKVASLPDF